MRKKIFKITLAFLVVAVIVISTIPVYASEITKNYYFEGLVNTGKDNGYSGAEKIDEKDPHFGWKMGDFFVSGYTSNTYDTNGNPVFLKTVGDKVTLWFSLKQNIDKLNGDPELSVYADVNGYDEYFGIEKTQFGKGTLIVRHRNYENRWGDPVIYTDYLSAHASQGINTKVELFEEGDYEVALNYEIRKAPLDVFGWKPFPTYYNYRIFFRFSVRNGNCMVFPFDTQTGEELTNTAITENGFYLDLAKSRYLDINIRKEMLAEGADGLVEDVRFNRPAKDGDCYTDEGIYTITVSNRYTNQQTIKKIYVGTNKILKAYMVTGLSIEEINRQLSLGAVINSDGTMSHPSATNYPLPETSAELETSKTLPESDVQTVNTETGGMGNGGNLSENVFGWIVLASVLLSTISICMVAFFQTGKAKKRCLTQNNGGVDE